MTHTRDALLAAAERLILEHGVDGASLRQITGEARANVAAVNYYFGSKDDLLVEVFQRRMRPVNAKRAALLDALLERSERPSLAELIQAFVQPIFEVPAEERSLFARLLARLHLDRTSLFRNAVVRGEEADAATRFIAAIGEATPHLSAAERSRRLDYFLGALTYALAGGIVHDAVAVSGRTESQMVTAFLVTAFAAPPAKLDAVDSEQPS
jgi:AcrR family transcriptional regulator